MPAGNWNSPLNLNVFSAGRKRVEWPAGPLTVDAGDVATWVEAWVVQRSTGASQRSVQSAFQPGDTTWLADGGTWVEGSFAPGWAMGIALVSTVRDKATHAGAKFYWWVDMVELRD
jgi:hypothetical protein